jgi:hypothetical protein
MYIPDTILIDLSAYNSDHKALRSNVRSICSYMNTSVTGRHRIIFSGLEQWCDHDMAHLSDLINSSNIEPFFYFSGAGTLTPEFMLSLIEMGVTSVILSLEGPPDVHDSLTGIKGSFRRVLEAMPFLQDLDMGIQVFTEIDHGNYSTLPYVYAMLNKYDLHSWHVHVQYDSFHHQRVDSVSWDKYDAVFSYLYLVERTGIQVNYVETKEIEQVKQAIVQYGINSENKILREMILDSKALMKNALFHNLDKFTPGGNISVKSHSLLYLKNLNDLYLTPWDLLPLGNLKERTLEDILSSDTVINGERDDGLPSRRCMGCLLMTQCRQRYGTTYMRDQSQGAESK